MSQLLFTLLQNSDLEPGSLAPVPVKECLSSWIYELTSENGGQRQKRKTSFLHVFYLGCQEKVWTSFGVGLLTSNDPDLK